MSMHDNQKSLVEDVLAGNITRRTLLKRAAILGVSAPVLASLLAACEEDDDGVDDVDEPAVDPDDDVAVEDNGEEDSRRPMTSRSTNRTRVMTTRQRPQVKPAAVVGWICFGGRP